MENKIKDFDTFRSSIISESYTEEETMNEGTVKADMKLVKVMEDDMDSINTDTPPEDVISALKKQTLSEDNGDVEFILTEDKGRILPIVLTFRASDELMGDEDCPDYVKDNLYYISIIDDKNRNHHYPISKKQLQEFAKMLMKYTK